MVQTKPVVEQITPLVQRQAVEEEEPVQMKENSPGISAHISPNFQTSLNGITSQGGKALSKADRAFFEPRFGADLGNIRIHDNEQAAQAAKQINAKAFALGNNVVFGGGSYSSESSAQRSLMAHELTHVLQQRNNISRSVIQCARGDLVRYSGGTSGTLSVEKKGKHIFSTPAISGHPGSKEFEKGVGPIPSEEYVLHPQRTKPKVTELQDGVCGVSAISSGYQEITSNDPSACSDPTNHYCTVSCPTSDDPRQRCFTPSSCWGEKRIKIEGSARVRKPTGGFVTRSGFYIHGGDHSVTVTSGCIKVANNSAFDNIRKLKGRVRLCVGSACPKKQKESNKDADDS